MNLTRTDRTDEVFGSISVGTLKVMTPLTFCNYKKIYQAVQKGITEEDPINRTEV